MDLREQKIEACNNFIEKLWGEIECAAQEATAGYDVGDLPCENGGYVEHVEIITNPETGEEMELAFQADFEVKVWGTWEYDKGDYWTPPYVGFEEAEEDREVVITDIGYFEDGGEVDLFDLDKLARAIEENRDIDAKDIISSSAVSENKVRITEAELKRKIKRTLKEYISPWKG